MNEIIESRKPPVATTGILGWLRANLFSNWVNSIISLFVLYILIQFIPWILNWTIFAADFKYNFKGEEIIDRTMCSRVLDPENGGACWAIIYVRFYQFMYGFYPREEVWRVNLSYIMLAVAVVPLLFD
ncbi:MAG: amino acid ABC transporter permease, partial [Pelagibacteraceae bacterium]|nr:amino acid ABC transporter permease [Pelagibacteraceae bacterium]